MSKKTTSRTRKTDNFFGAVVSALIGTPKKHQGHHDTTISDGKHRVSGEAYKASESQEKAKRRWANRK